MNLYNKLFGKRLKTSIEISFNHKKQLSKEDSIGKIMPKSTFFNKVYIQKISKKKKSFLKMKESICTQPSV